MKTQILEKLNDLKIKSGKSFEDVHDALGFAASTVHRWHKGESNPDIDQLTTLVEFYGGSMEKLYAEVGKQEMVATANIGYQGANAMVEHYEARLQAKDNLLLEYERHFGCLLNQEKEHHQASIDYLTKEIERLRTVVHSLTSKRNVVFWVLVGIIVLLLAALSFALATDAIV